MRSKERTEPPRKRSRTSEDADDVAVTAGGKKARGRPRVDTQDATAADVSIAPHYTEYLYHFFSSMFSQSAARKTETDAAIASKNANPARATGIPATQRDNNIITQAAEYPTTCCYRRDEPVVLAPP